MALFESSLGFTWEIANYRQVQSGARRLHSLTFFFFIRRRLTHALHLFERCLLSHVGQVSVRMSRTAKPDSQECQGWTEARPTKRNKGCTRLDVRPFLYNHIWSHANFSFRCHAFHFLQLCPERFLNFLNDRRAEPTNLADLPTH